MAFPELNSLSYRKQACSQPRESEEYSVPYQCLRSTNQMHPWLAKAATVYTFLCRDHIEEFQWGHFQPLKF